jgi:hypothetical protein
MFLSAKIDSSRVICLPHCAIFFIENLMFCVGGSHATKKVKRGKTVILKLIDLGKFAATGTYLSAKFH